MPRRNAAVLEARFTSAALSAALAQTADELDVPLSSRQLDALLAYLDLLARWNATYNLTSVNKPSDMLTRHLADCLAILPPLRRQLGEPLKARILDVGSGAGLPGVVLAIAAPQTSLLCMDKVGKKVAFIRQVAAELGLGNLRAEQSRIESLKAGLFDVIVSRAFASLSDFVEMTIPHLTGEGVWLAMKGSRPAGELIAIAETAEVFHVEPLKVPGLEAQRCLVWMRRRQ
ncbi:MAG: 16S rRNA (guanine(527)-N(7))-methyltransferase RsmG [Burkholderiaceae bacterium]